MPDSIPKYLLDLRADLMDSLQKTYPDHNTILKFDDAAKKAIHLIQRRSAITHKIEPADIRRLVKYLVLEGAPIGILADGCYWASNWAELHFAKGFVTGRKNYYSEIEKAYEKINLMEPV